MFKQLVNGAAGGDAKATKTLLLLLEKNVASAQTSSPIHVIIEGVDARL